MHACCCNHRCRQSTVFIRTEWIGLTWCCPTKPKGQIHRCEFCIPWGTLLSGEYSSRYLFSSKWTPSWRWPHSKSQHSTVTTARGTLIGAVTSISECIPSDCEDVLFFCPNPPIFDKLEDIIGRAIVPALCVLWSLMISQCTKGRIGSALQHFYYHRVFSATQDDPYTSYQTMKSATLVLHFAY